MATDIKSKIINNRIVVSFVVEGTPRELNFSPDTKPKRIKQAIINAEVDFITAKNTVAALSKVTSLDASEEIAARMGN